MGMGKGGATCVCQIDKGFLIPHGILKIFETIFNIICLALAVQYWGYGCLEGVRGKSILDIINYAVACGDCYDFVLATAALFFVATLLLFILFLFCVPEMCAGRKVWNIIDLVHDVIAIIFYLISFILTCVFANGVGALIALAIFALLNLILYIISLVFTVMAMKGRTIITVNAT